jgi:crotonobetainyl-CoA:carnitine CoA-transferase CaiB-like acyl-CoA transferase
MIDESSKQPTAQDAQSVAARRMWSALDLREAALGRLAFRASDELPSVYRVSDLAAAAVGAAALAISELVAVEGHAPRVGVDRRLAALWFGWSIKPVGWDMPAAWDPIAGDYRAADGWIRLHTNAPRHRAAALAVLECAADRDAVAAAVERWSADDLETAVVAAGGCAAAMRTEAAWASHPQGAAVAAEPLVAMKALANGDRAWGWRPNSERPLAGIRVLDVTRVLAGPVATRFLAGFGASVLRIDPPDWDEPGVIPEVTLGKRCARLDLERSEDRAVFEGLLATAHVLVHGYRPGALEALGYGEDTRRALGPQIIDVALDAYGWTGPWKARRGFDSLVQMSSGMAAQGMAWRKADRPTPLPVQALDQATGYLMAATAVRGLIGRLTSGESLRGRVSLARTASELARLGRLGNARPWTDASDADVSSVLETTDWGPARRLKAPAAVENAPMRWESGARRLGSAAAAW